MAGSGGATSSLESVREQPLEQVAACVFTGRGSEYFRIWVVNVLLTLLTLGLYSAWAKVRRTKYFYQNTRLEGFVFDYHGNPKAILRGRLIAGVLVVLYTWGADFSRTAGYITSALLCLATPWLFIRAQQFKLGNTSWRGLRFGFEAHATEAFGVVLPIWFILSSPEWMPDGFSKPFSILLALLAIPWLHHRLKAYQHARPWYGDQAFSFTSIPSRFYAVYAKGLLVVILGSILGFVATILLLDWVPPSLIGFAGPLLIGLISWPFFSARLQQEVWAATRVGDAVVRTEIQAGKLFDLVLKNVLLTLATLGLYWPFAVVALAKYRVECMSIHTLSPTSKIAAGLHSGGVGATGEGVWDGFGLEIGL